MNNIKFRNLEVPYFSQRGNIRSWKRRYTEKESIDLTGDDLLTGTIDENKESVSMAQQSCNVTSLAMVLHYLGTTENTPDEMMRKVFSPTDEEKKKYTKEQMNLVEQTYGAKGDEFFESPENMRNFAYRFYGIDTEDQSFYSHDFEYVKNHVLAGYPVILSCGILRNYEGSSYDADAKAGAVTEVFGKNSKIQYDSKISEYNKTIEDGNKKLKEEITEEQKTATEKEISTANTEKEKLESAYKTSKNYYLEKYRYHGHYVVVRGITEDSVILNDPWGKPVIDKNGKGNYTLNMIGDNISIPGDEFKKQYFESGKVWSCLVFKYKRWGFVSRSDSFNTENKDFLDECQKCEMFEFGGYPIKRSNLWHNGLHYSSRIGSSIYPIGPGQIVAARVVNRDSDTKEEPLNGSRCFVLVKHQARVGTAGKEVLKDFYSLYMHLKPVADLEEIADKYPQKKSGIKWLDDLIYRSKDFRRLLLYITEPDFYELTDTEKKKPVGKLSKAGIILVDSVNQKDKKVVFYYEVNGKVGKYWTTIDVYNAFEEKNRKVYENKINALKTGKIIYFNEKELLDIDSMVEVSRSEPIGQMGTFGGYDCNHKKETLHLEIFSNDNIIQNPDTKGFTVLKYAEMSAAICDREEMIKIFEDKKLYGNFVDNFLYLKEDGVISKDEMIKFYESEDGAKRFRNYICQHTSEWSDKINWESEFQKAKGVPNKSFLSFLPPVKTTGEEFEGTLQEYVSNVYEPYKWFNQECINAMKTDEKNYFSQGKATFYHPAEFIQWLINNDSK